MERVGFARSGAGGIGIGEDGIPDPELYALIQQRIALGPDVEAQGVGAERSPGVQLHPAPAPKLCQPAEQDTPAEHPSQTPHLPPGQPAREPDRHQKRPSLWK